MSELCTVCGEPYDTKEYRRNITLDAAGRDATWCVASGQVGTIVIYEHR
jgi:hypothetical protein